MQRIVARDVAEIMRRTLNHVDNHLVNHGSRVSFIVYKMLRAWGETDPLKLRDACMLSMLHDIGAYKTEEVEDMLQFETEAPWNHSVYGYLFLRELSPLGDLAEAVLYHHLDYCLLVKEKTPLKFLAQVLNLADCVDMYFISQGEDGLMEYLEDFRDSKFQGEVIDLFQHTEAACGILEALRTEEYLREILDMLSESLLSEKDSRAYLKLVVFSIDFRSPFTVMHTIITTRLSVELAAACRMSAEGIEKVHYGALLHDLGKIAIPIEILEFPGKLSVQAMGVMRTHVDLTREILGDYMDTEVCEIALRHHEKLDGTGYPQGLLECDLTLAQRIVAVADVVSALLGKRSYKDAYHKDKVLEIVIRMKEQRLICPHVVDTLVKNYEGIMKRVQDVCQPVLKSYLSINEEYEQMMKGLEQPL